MSAQPKTKPKVLWNGGTGPFIGETWRIHGTYKWRFHIRATNGRITATGGQEYNRKRNCFETLDSFRPVLRKILQLPPR